MRTTKFFRCLIIAALSLPMAPLMAVPAKPIAAAKPKPKPAKKKVPAPDGLRPGQYVWESRTKASPNLRIVAVLDIQRLYVFDGDDLVAFTTISSGRRGHETPPGVYTVLEKDVDHTSSIYDDAPMPFMQRLTWDGIALHAGHNPGFAASHGCIRLPLSFSKSLYSVTKMGQQVVVLSDLGHPSPPKVEQPPEQPKPPVDPAKPPEVPVGPTDPATPAAAPPPGVPVVLPPADAETPPKP